MTDWSSSEPPRIEPVLQTPTHTAAWAHALVHQHQNWLIRCAGGAALLTLGQQLQSHCHALAPSVRTLHFSALQPAGWLAHINEALARQGLEQAMQPSADLTPQDICLVHEAHALAADEWSLLLRLNGLFPGCPLRWVLLVDSQQPVSDDPQRLLAAHAAHWRLFDDTPNGSPTPVEPATAFAPATADEPSISTTTSATTSATASATTMAPTLADARQPPTTTTTAAHARPRQPLALWSLLLFGLLALGAWVVYLRPAQGPGFSEPARAAAPSSSEPATPTPTPTPTPTTDTDTNTPNAQAEPTAAAATATPLADAPAGPMPEPGLTAAESAPPEPPLPEVVRRDLRWLLSLPEDSYVLERGAFDTLQQAQRLINAQAELATARIIMLRPDASAPSRFLVVTGPFRSLERAQNFRFRLQLPSQAPIEQVDALRQKSIPLPTDR